ncbi:MAG: Lar family restriction alleviation protein [Prevotella sp.]
MVLGNQPAEHRKPEVDTQGAWLRMGRAYGEVAMRAKTRPCPFCGGDAQKVKESSRWGWFVSCACAAVGPSADSREEAIEAWNRRVEPKQTRLEL